MSRKTVPAAPADIDLPRRTVPALAEVHPPFGVIAQRIADLQVEAGELDRERNALVTQVGELQLRSDQDQLKAVISGVPLPDPAPVQQRLAQVENRRLLIKEALHQLVIQRTEEYRRASLRVCDHFAEERRTLTMEMFEGLAAAAAARVKLGLLALDIERAGADAGGFEQPLRDMFGPALARNSDLAIELRHAIAAGYLPESALPAELR
ncbi:hypothetical protein [Mesorhizobium sp. M4B.F.Ca.ET.013.02.1.1]|uniref:hypothetical protein n=1 Tax=Mesorhizobium sp. M4B.F.Ca.ET.013.02.1.1 TaxID=2496755 RepID=UPI000FD45C2D|nr:hypothetical protein [Mesorhizobium sp. M4B.F.Ca.ET.013.02.1.1]RUW17385.1 hypothetical protein EOA34_34170 [Mesorhizobium sp. M4B.F.Ca.ET.013.02.1.1]